MTQGERPRSPPAGAQLEAELVFLIWGFGVSFWGSGFGVLGFRVLGSRVFRV